MALHAAISVESSNAHQSIVRASTMVLEEQKSLLSQEQFQKRVEENFDVFKFQLESEEMKIVNKLGQANMRTTWNPNDVP